MTDFSFVGNSQKVHEGRNIGTGEATLRSHFVVGVCHVLSRQVRSWQKHANC